MKLSLSLSLGLALTVIAVVSSLYFYFDRSSHEKSELQLEMSFSDWKNRQVQLQQHKTGGAASVTAKHLIDGLSVVQKVSKGNTFAPTQSSVITPVTSVFNIPEPSPFCGTTMPGGNVYIFADINASTSCHVSAYGGNFSVGANNNVSTYTYGVRIFNVTVFSLPFGINGTFQMASGTTLYVELQPDPLLSVFYSPIQPMMINVIQANDCLGGFNSFIINRCPSLYYCSIVQTSGAKCNFWLSMMPTQRYITPIFYTIQMNQDCNWFTTATFLNIIWQANPWINTSYLIPEPISCGSASVSFRCVGWTPDFALALCAVIFGQAGTSGSPLNVMLQVLNVYVAPAPTIMASANNQPNYSVWYAFFACFAIPLLGALIWVVVDHNRKPQKKEVVEAVVMSKPPTGTPGHGYSYTIGTPSPTPINTVEV